MYSQITYINPKDCRIGDYYPEHPTDAQRDDIRKELGRQWRCIATGEVWDPDRLPEPILALLDGPLAWCRLPGVSASKDGGAEIPAWSPFAINGEARWVKTWQRPDGVYLTLSSEGAQYLGVRPVGLTMRRRKIARAAGITDAVWDVWERTRFTASGNLRLRFLRGTKKHPIANPPPLYRWAKDTEGPIRRTHQAFPSLDAIGTNNIPDDCCQAEKERVFTRPDVEMEAIDRAIMATA